MSTTVSYCGPLSAIDLPSCGVFGAEKGDPIEVDADVAAELIERGDFERPKAKKAAASKKAAPKTAPADPPAEDTNPPQEG